MGKIETTGKKNLRMKPKYIYFSLLIILICLSCKNREAYYNFYELKDSEWSKLDTLYFDIDSAAIQLNTPYDICIELVNNSDYPYQNIWLYFQDNFERNSFVKVEKQYELADPLGKWYGSGFGSLYELSLDYKKRISFSEKRNYQLKVVQGMRDEPLVGIEKIGVRLIPSEID
jgi:gliding motility-associated lipoprotein GldH